MCDPDIGCQLRRNYFGFRLGLTGNAEGAVGEYSQIPVYGGFGLGGNAGVGGDFALTWRRADSDSPQDGSFEGWGGNVGYQLSYSARGSLVHMPYITAEIWTHDARITPYVGVAYTAEQFLNGGDLRHGGRILIGLLHRPWTSPFQGDHANPYWGGQIYIGGEGGDGQGGFVIGLQLEAGMDFFPLF